MADDMDLEVPVAGPSRPYTLALLSGEQLELDLDAFDDTDESMGELRLYFKEEGSGPDVWTRFAAEYWRRFAPDKAFKMAQWGLEELRPRRQQEELELPILCQMANYNLALARKAPTLVMKDARADKLPSDTLTKGYYYQQATQLLQAVERIEPSHPVVLNTRASLLLATGKLDDAVKVFDRIIAQHPTHTFAQMGKARVLCARRQHRAALKLYQNVLTVAPQSLPDPRIGIGICYYNLGERALAQKAWERSTVVHPGKESLGATLLLGLLHLNAGRDPSATIEARAVEYEKGIMALQSVFKQDKTIAMVASALAGHFLTNHEWDRAIKLGERALQYADSRAALSEAHLVIARALHAQDKLAEAAPHYAKACEKAPEQLVAAIAAAQIYVVNGSSNYPNAVNAFENILKQHPTCIEALVNLAAVHAHTGFDPNASERDKERKRAIELYEQIARIIAPRLLDSQAMLTNGHGEMPANATPRVKEVGSDPDLYVEIARLYADSDPQRALRALRESSRLRPEDKQVAALLSNIGCLEYMQNNMAEAQTRFEDALGATSTQPFATEMAAEATRMTISYNLAIAYEAVGETDKALAFYEQMILTRHPEFVEAKGRLALIYLRRRDRDKAHELLKQALTADQRHKEIRALYTYFLMEIGDLGNLRTFLEATLQQDKKEVYAHCAMGILAYQKARENKQSGPEAAKERAHRYIRAADSFYQCLQYDPQCAVAAQGLAIALAEGVLGGGKEVVSGTPAASETEKRLRNTRDALTILTKIREAVRDGAVYVNIGHCHFAREEWDKAIEAYETASRRYYGGKNISVLLLAARSWFFKAVRDERYAFMSNALNYAKQALELSPKDDSIRFNIAIVQHRGLEILNALDDEKNEAKLAKRTVVEMEQAIQEVEEAQMTFAALGANQAKQLPYSSELASQREAFGRSLLKSARDSIPRQAEFEQLEEAKATNARKARELAKEKQAAEENARLAEIAIRAEQLARDRRAQQEEAATWYTAQSILEDEEESKKKKGRRKKVVKEGSLTPAGSDEEEEDKPKRKRPAKKRVPKEEDGEPEGEVPADEQGEAEEEDDIIQRPAKKSRKVYKSAEIIEDSDEE